MPEPQDKKSKRPNAAEKPPRNEEARQVAQEYADDQRAIIEKLRSRINGSGARRAQ